MIQTTSDLNLKILAIADGEEDFKIELTKAIHSGLIELKTVYKQGTEAKDEVMIQQIRHKMKPTLAMFEFEELIVEMQNGKEIVEAEGFSNRFSDHALEIDRLVAAEIEKVGMLLK
ncbi:hypothetical protein JYB64_06285 [Algoriphagus aestuarii]|nr:hypothetical protein [Algoriphagus aestuarii]